MEERTKQLELVKLEELSKDQLGGLEGSKAKQFMDAFKPMTDAIDEIEEAYNDLTAEAEKGITKDITDRAKQLRLHVGRIRISAEKAKTEQKAEIIRAGKALDGMYNIIKYLTGDKEAKLRGIEEHYEALEQARIDAEQREQEEAVARLQAERVKLLSPYVTQESGELERDLAAIDAGVWETFLGSRKRDHDEEVAAKEKVETDRIEKQRADAEELTRLEAENARLKLESDKLAEQEEERAAIEKKKQDKRDIDETARIAKEMVAEQKREDEKRAVLAGYQAERERAQEEREVAETKERRRRDSAEAALRAIEAAELKAKQKEAAALQAELRKGDVDKTHDLADAVAALKTGYVFKSEKSRRMYKVVVSMLDKILDEVMG